MKLVELGHLSGLSRLRISEVSVLEVYLKLRRWGQQVLLAVCDVDLLGKTLKEEEVVFSISEDFYKGHRANVDEALDLIEKSTIVNLVGCNIVKKAVEKGFVHPEAVIEICDVPHAQIVKM